MKTDDIARALRNRTSPAATLARWQSIRPAARLSTIRNRNPASITLAARRAYAMQHDNGSPELSAPNSAAPFLWFDGTSSPEILHAYPGRDFLRYRGWFTDDDQSETIEAYAVILADFPHLIFEAIRESVSDGIRIDLSTASTIDYSEAESDYDASEARRDAARDAIRSADSTAEREAESEREHQARAQAEQELEEARADLAAIRADFRNLCHELREICSGPMPTIYPAAADAIRAQVRALISRRSETLDTIAEHKQALS
jgi:hypothetical protein